MLLLSSCPRLPGGTSYGNTMRWAAKAWRPIVSLAADNSADAPFRKCPLRSTSVAASPPSAAQRSISAAPATLHDAAGAQFAIDTQGRRAWTTLGGVEEYLYEGPNRTMMGRDMDYDDAHAAVILKYGVSDFALYHPRRVYCMASILQFSVGQLLKFVM